MRFSPPTFTKEKAVFLAASLVCAGLTFRFITSQPVLLVSGAPIGGGKVELLSPPQANVSGAEEGSYFQGARKSPFVVPKTKPHITTTKDETAGTVPKPPPETTVKKETPAFTGTPPEELYAFSGVIVWKGTPHALLAGKKKAATLRAREGDSIAGGFRITRIAKQSIELKHESGHVFVLKDKGA